MDPYNVKVVDAFLRAVLFASPVDDFDRELPEVDYIENWDEKFTVSDFMPEARAKVDNWVKTFVDAVRAKHPDFTPDPEDLGHDLYLTSAGHGCGFWDGDWKHHGEEVVETLNKESKRVPEEGLAWGVFYDRVAHKLNIG